jgi:hypothetical protein
MRHRQHFSNALIAFVTAVTVLGCASRSAHRRQLHGQLRWPALDVDEDNVYVRS